jgi:geranylgeranyl diphosphate synthase type II
MSAALGLEIFHNFTLLHDDIMDRADTRRGQATVHKKWNDNAAILSGDAMLICAYQHMSQVESHLLSNIMMLFSKVAMEVCKGQQLDMSFETRDDVTVDEYIEMIRLKTAVLLATSLEIGAIIGGAPVSDSDLLYNYGINLGLAFQLRDDYLDAFGDPKEFGKQIGGDIKCNKKTFLLLNALKSAEGATAENLKNWISSSEIADEQAKIQAVLDIYRETGSDKRCEEAIQDFFEKSVVCAKQLQIPENKKDILINLAYHLMGRKK